MMKGYRLLLAWFVFIVALALFLFSCKEIEYVPVEVVKTEIVHKTDTVTERVEVNNQTNTILRDSRPEDSAMIANLGIRLKDNERLLILMQNQISDMSKERNENHIKDSVRVDSIQVPVPVERKLNKWETFCIDYGKVTLGMSIAAIVIAICWLIIWIRRKVIR